VTRAIAKPVAGTVKLAVDGVETDGFALEAATGAVTLDEAPGEGQVVTAGFWFDTPVRFDTDRLEVTLDSFEGGRMAAVPLVEIRGV